MIKFNMSQRINREFANEVSRMSIESGIELHVARNILRFNKTFRRPTPVKNKVWTDPKTGLALTQAQWTGPLEKLREKVKNGTNPNKATRYDDCFESAQDPEVTFSDALVNGMMHDHAANVLLSREQLELHYQQVISEADQAVWEE
jgi:hypothetical protein